MGEPKVLVDPLSIIHGDCVEVMRGMAENSVDAIVTDPPYGLGFMGKTWDADFEPADMPMRRSGAQDAVNTGAARQGGRQRAGLDYQKRMARDSRSFGDWCESWAREALRVLKPGGYLLSFGGTRTFHRMTCAIEDAGFEIRDCLMWLYGSGFPKSLDVSKAMDKAAGVEREVVGIRTYAGPAGNSDSFGVNGSGQPNGGKRDVTAPATDLAKQWSGWGTALKPAWEPIILARKPLIGTVVANVTEHGTGALNIDGTRIAGAPRNPSFRNPSSNGLFGGADNGALVGYESPAGRWPANVLLDEEAAAMLDAQSGDRPGGNYPAQRGQPVVTLFGKDSAPTSGGARSMGDSGGASRFFYTAKASRSERNGSTHPTVKPVDLMRYLCRLVTPRGGLVLDPFAGSGTTGQAALAEGFRCILIEREAEYVAGIKTWRANMQLGLGFSA